MDELKKRLWLAEFTWRAWKAAKQELEQELECTIGELRFQVSRLTPTPEEAMFAATPDEILQRTRDASFERWRKGKNYGVAQTNQEHETMWAEFKGEK